MSHITHTQRFDLVAQFVWVDRARKNIEPALTHLRRTQIYNNDCVWSLAGEQHGNVLQHSMSICPIYMVISAGNCESEQPKPNDCLRLKRSQMPSWDRWVIKCIRRQNFTQTRLNIAFYGEWEENFQRDILEVQYGNRFYNIEAKKSKKWSLSLQFREFSHQWTYDERKFNWCK
jgi:hypothetical protein